jgi:hypothetical protein
MKLPNGGLAVVDIAKLREYCLNPHHARGRHKARVFASIDIHQDDAEVLLEALLSAAREAEARAGDANQYGQRYLVDFEFIRHGRTAKIRSLWIVRIGENLPRLTTCYVL